MTFSPASAALYVCCRSESGSMLKCQTEMVTMVCITPADSHHVSMCQFEFKSTAGKWSCSLQVDSFVRMRYIHKLFAVSRLAVTTLKSSILVAHITIAIVSPADFNTRACTVLQRCIAHWVQGSFVNSDCIYEEPPTLFCVSLARGGQLEFTRSDSQASRVWAAFVCWTDVGGKQRPPVCLPV